jgi:hypothetical protein
MFLHGSWIMLRLEHHLSLEQNMKVRLRISKNAGSIYSGTYDVVDADSFGNACADAWRKLQQQQMQSATSIGALMEHLADSVIDQLNGAHICLERA